VVDGTNAGGGGMSWQNEGVVNRKSSGVGRIEVRSDMGLGFT
jgi:hypothetical protein